MESIGEQEMKRDFLKGLELTDEVIDKIMAEYGKSVEAEKAKVTTAQTELDGLKKQLTDANAAIESFKKLDPEALQKAVDEWKVKAETAQTEAEKQIAQLKFDHALDGALAGAKAKNAAAVKALLKLDDLKLSEDGSVSGLKDQLEKIQVENDYLFESGTPNPKIVTKSNNQSVLTDKVVLAAREAAGISISTGEDKK